MNNWKSVEKFLCDRLDKLELSTEKLKSTYIALYRLLHVVISWLKEDNCSLVYAIALVTLLEFPMDLHV